MTGLSESDAISTKQERIAELARQMPGKALHAISRHIDAAWMHEAYRRTRKDGAAGVDGQTAESYASDLDANLADLLDRAKSGTYRAPPVRRTYIPKPDGRQRPLGIPTFEDKVLQRAVVMALEPLYEQDFLDCSYGFRPGRSAHQALAALWRGLMDLRGGWVLDVDIQGFFDTLDHRILQDLLRQRVTDGVIVRLIGKWLNAGVQEDGAVRRSDKGTPQGGVISPLLANVYLHVVLDEWFANDVMPRLQGRAFMVRYADDFVIAFEREDDARRVHEVLPKRMSRFGLTLHPEKTRLVPFVRPPLAGGPDDDPPESFNLLGFTHYWARSRAGRWVVKRKTMKARFQRALASITEWCRRARHRPIGDQARGLAQRLRGHFNYYGITGNSTALVRFRCEVVRTWFKWLNRRSQRKRLDWTGMNGLLLRVALPTPVTVHSALRPPANL